MPNPYVGNDDAARFVDYYASRRMQQDSVRRLYSESLHHRKESIRRVEENVYPQQTPSYRTQREIDDYLNRLVYEETFRRQRKLVDLEWDLYHPPPTPHRTPDQIASHVARMHDQQVRNKARREMDINRRFGTGKDGTPNARTEEVEMQRQLNREREEGWRPPSAHVKHNDGAMLLVSELGAIHEEAVPRELAASETPRRNRVNKTRLSELSKPLRVTPRTQREEDPLIPPFRVVGNISPHRSKKLR